MNEDFVIPLQKTRDERTAAIAAAKVEAEYRTLIADLAADLHDAANVDLDHVVPGQVDSIELWLHKALAKLPAVRKAGQRLVQMAPHRFY